MEVADEKAEAEDEDEAGGAEVGTADDALEAEACCEAEDEGEEDDAVEEEEEATGGSGWACA